MKKLLEFFQDNNGSYSSTRLFMLLTCFTFIFTWNYSVIKYGDFKPDITLLIFTGLVLGIKVFEDVAKLFFKKDK
ncbi:MAG TPA: hypothetical protein PLY35_09415 [Thermotogota bacterium]|nr:hypothetical protein [Thermotogota bacterium]